MKCYTGEDDCDLSEQSELDKLNDSSTEKEEFESMMPKRKYRYLKRKKQTMAERKVAAV